MRGVRAFDAAALLLATLLGLAIGIGVFTFVYAKGASYLTDDPSACANCHVMREEFGAWMKGPHHGVAVCNDCHTPHNKVAKYAIKARNGFWHSYYFTRGKFPEPIQITPLNREVTEKACRSCHADEDIHLGRLGDDCARCHNPNAWKLWRFDHEREAHFALRGAHETLDCHACHRAPLDAEAELPTTCGGCHAADDPHGGAYGNACERCHGETSWSDVEVTH